MDVCRVWRDTLLMRSDWAMATDAPTDKTAWAAYRQALRDFPATWEPSAVADFPNPPGYVEPEAPASDDAGAPSTDAG
jgi:hypothetical protein